MPNRDHTPILIEEFNGLWKRGDDESVPLDHFSDCNNISYIESGFRTRDGLATYTIGGYAFNDVRRMYTFVHGGVESIILLDGNGDIFDTNSPTPFTPILSIPAMTDFAFVSYAGRGYISPHDGNLGLNGEFLYVYLGDGSVARKAGGAAPTSVMTLALSFPGNVERGIHIFAVVYETNTGFLTKIGINPTAADAEYNSNGLNAVTCSSIPVSPDSFVIKRHIVATKAIDPALYTGDTAGYEFFFVPDGNIDDNVTTTKTVNFYDSELLESASYLLDLYEEIPAGAVLETYHNRLVCAGLYGVATSSALTDESGKWSTALVSTAGEPEAFNTVDGLIVAPLDGKPLTNAQEYRDVLYLFKATRTYAYNDNGDVPSSWPVTAIDLGVGASIHGIANVLDSGGVNVEYLIIVDFSGIMIFNGAYQRPELSYKIKDYWMALDRDEFNEIQILNDSISQILYLVLPNDKMLIGDYSRGMDPKAIRWAIWSFDPAILVTTITLIDTNSLILGAMVHP